MRTLSTLLISSAVIAALLSGASMAMRAPATGDGQEAAQAARVAAGPPASAWSDPPERAVPVMRNAVPAPSDKPLAVAQVSEPQPHAPQSTTREMPRRALARGDVPRRSEAARAPRRMAQASLRPRAAAPRADAAVALAPPPRPIDPISDFLRGVGLLGDDHG